VITKGQAIKRHHQPETLNNSIINVTKGMQNIPPPQYQLTVYGSHRKFDGEAFNGGEQFTCSSLTEAHKKLRYFQQDKDNSSSCWFSLEPLVDCRYHTTTKFFKHDRVYMIDDPSIKGTIVSARKRRLQDWQKLSVLTDDGVRFSTCSYFRVLDRECKS
jgi:hypothetical protein